jgi:hypothetical protein
MELYFSTLSAIEPGSGHARQAAFFAREAGYGVSVTDSSEITPGIFSTNTYVFEEQSMLCSDLKTLPLCHQGIAAVLKEGSVQKSGRCGKVDCQSRGYMMICGEYPNSLRLLRPISVPLRCKS